MPAAPHPTAAPRRYADRRARRAAAKRCLRQRRLVIIAVVLSGLLLAGASPLDWWIRASGEEVVVPPPELPVVATAPPVPAPTPTVSPSPSPSPGPSDVATALSLSGDFPTAGPGTFTYAQGEGEVLGDSGQLRRFRVAIEEGIDVDLSGFAGFAEDTLGHEQGWTAAGDRRFQRVPDGGGHDFTIFLVTSETAGQMCAAAGLYVLAPGFPTGGVSCRTPGQVILNLSRWQLSVPHYVAAEVPLAVYRQMLLNHEVGHELGYGHYGCPAAGGPAPVMQQQTLSMGGCEANPWPYLDGRYHTGPPAQ